MLNPLDVDKAQARRFPPATPCYQHAGFLLNPGASILSSAHLHRKQCPRRLHHNAARWVMRQSSQDDAIKPVNLLDNVSPRAEKLATLEDARATVDGFQVPPFAPYISENGHVQTIVSNFYPPAPEVKYSRVTLPTDDGLDTLQIDIANGTTLAPEKDNQPVALLLHGLESSSTETITLRLADALSREGFKVVAMNYRSCAARSGPPSTLRLYHAGFTEDVTTVLRALRRASEESGDGAPNVYLSGFSLGSNIMCNVLREAGTDAFEKYGVVSAFGVCTPFDLAVCEQAIDSGLRGMVYSYRYVESMVKKVDAAVKAGVPFENIDLEEVARAKRIGEMNNNYIAPVFGFKDKYDYYQTVDARECLRYIAVPTLLLNARNDPFFGHEDGSSFPSEEDIGNAPVRLIITESGGHCGYMDYDGFYRKQPMYHPRVCAMYCSYIQATLGLEKYQS